MRSLCFLALLVVLTGCASEIQKRNAERFTLIGMQAQAQGDWDTARRAYARAVVNGEQAKLPQRTLAVLTYEYGRSLGVSCFFDLAEAELNRAHELDRQAGNPLYLSLTELVRLTFDQQKFQAAIAYFERAIAEMDRANLCILRRVYCLTEILLIFYKDKLKHYVFLYNLYNNIVQY